MDHLTIARDAIREALAFHIKGKNKEERLDYAADEVLGAISHMITTQEDVKKHSKGATVMTETASFGKIPPRNV